MMHKIVSKLFEEYNDFNAYKHIYQECTNADAKSIIKKIMEDEHHHYKYLYDLVFANADISKMTDIEKAVHEYATHLQHKMSDCMNKLK